MRINMASPLPSRKPVFSRRSRWIPLYRLVVGTAPVHFRSDGYGGAVNVPKLVYNYQEAVSELGYHADFEKYTLCEFMKCYFGLYSVGPVVLVNVFDPATHKTSVETAEAHTLVDDEALLDHAGVIPNSETVQDSEDSLTYVKGTDYSIDYPTGTITRLTGGSIAAGAVLHVTYDYGDPSLVTDADIVGGVDAETEALTGLELVNQVYPRWGKVPGLICAPGWSDTPGTALMMASKAGNINGHFKAMAIVDVPETVTKYSDVFTHKTDNSLTDELMIVCWPRVTVDGVKYWLSSHVAGIIGQVDAARGSIPYKSPSNETLQITGAVAGTAEIWLSDTQATALNAQGIVTALNGVNGWKTWGNRTAVYPGVTDVKDAFIPTRRMFNWVGNTLVTSAAQRVDFPITRRLIDSIVDSFNIWLNGLTAQGAILGGVVKFLAADNTTTDIMDGIIRFHVYLTPPSPAREINFILEYDPSYIATLF